MGYDYVNTSYSFRTIDSIDGFIEKPNINVNLNFIQMLIDISKLMLRPAATGEIKHLLIVMQIRFPCKINT